MAQGMECEAKIAVFGSRWLYLYCLTDKFDGESIIAGVVGNDAQVVQRIRMVWFIFKCSAANKFRLSESPRSKVLSRDFQVASACLDYRPLIPV